MLPRKMRRLLADLGGDSYRHTIGLLAEQTESAEEGAQVACAMAAGEITTSDAHEAISAVEQVGDAQRAALVAALGRSLTTPVDREDIYRISRSIDDVLDNLRDYVRESDLYRPTDQRAAVPMVTAIADGMRTLREGVLTVISAPESSRHIAIEVRRHGNSVRRQYQRALADLFTRTTVDVEMLKQRELLRRIDVVALRLGEAADALSDGLLKRSQ